MLKLYGERGVNSRAVTVRERGSEAGQNLPRRTFILSYFWVYLGPLAGLSASRSGLTWCSSYQSGHNQGHAKIKCSPPGWLRQLLCSEEVTVAAEAFH